MLLAKTRQTSSLTAADAFCAAAMAAAADLSLTYLISHLPHHCCLPLCCAGAAADAANRKLLSDRNLQQGRPWEQFLPGNQGPGNRPGNQGQGQGNRPQGFGGSGSSAGSGAAAGGGQNRDRPNPNRNKGDRGSLSRLNSQALNLRNRPKQAILVPTTGLGSDIFKGLRTRGNSRAAAKSLAEAFGSNSEAAATGLASAATEGGRSEAVAEAVAATTVAAPNVAPGLYLRWSSHAQHHGNSTNRGGAC
jgi:hypothetical protein